jgi:hypothetical protein
LFIRSNWEPPPAEISPFWQSRIKSFSTHIRELFVPRRCGYNLLLQQRIQLDQLRQNHNLVVFKTDKNLGPALLERDIYIRRALSDHLLNQVHYRQLTEVAAEGRILAIKKIIVAFLLKHFKNNNDPDRKYLFRSLQVKDPYAFFYLLVKVHKTPWATRPIISCSGSLLQGLGRWVDVQLSHYY